MLKLKNNQEGFIPLMITLVAIIIIAMVVVYIRVNHAHSVQIKY